MTELAQIALKAAKLRKKIGRWASWRYAEKRGCPASLYRMACQLQAVG